MYLIGIFNRDYFDFSSNENPMSLVGLVEKLTKEYLVKASQEDDYQVINLYTKEYYDPKNNKWIKLGKF